VARLVERARMRRPTVHHPLGAMTSAPASACAMAMLA